MSEEGIIGGQQTRRVKLERAKELRRQMTPQEAQLWRCLKTNQLYGLHFRRQQVIDGFIVDFYCHAARLVVEVDGGIHLSQRGYDAARDEVLQGRGLVILRITNDEVEHEMLAVLSRIASACGIPFPIAQATATDTSQF